MTATRTADLGNCYEYDETGRRLAGTDRQTIDGMVALSALWPTTWHQYVGPTGYVTWARGGREVGASELPAALR